MYTNDKLGYGKYTFNMVTNQYQFDKNIVDGQYQTLTGGNFYFDLWMYKGVPPYIGIDQELVISNFSYVPLVNRS